ncbi:MAG TPA: hypothetical protein VLM75_03665 [Spirochaetota bacterium]|nr:hypothetical protein [Spirochaetota bacterium]
MNGHAGNRHEGCYFCGPRGYLFNGWERTPAGGRAVLKIDGRHEGWPGIPHGGVGMTSIVELADLADPSVFEQGWCADFRFGGDRIAVGNEVTVDIKGAGGSWNGSIVGPGGGNPYLRATVRQVSGGLVEGERENMEALLAEPVKAESSFVIPVFSDKIIFRDRYQSLHTRRVFEFRETETGNIYTECLHEGESGSMQCTEMNTISPSRVHPGAIIAILDETLAWAGFLTVWQGGVTVDLSVHFAGPVFLNDRIFSVGFCTGVKGRHRRKLALCSGGIFAARGGRFVPIVTATGRWLTDPEYKEKMLGYIMPEALSLIAEVHRKLNS